MIEKKRVQRIAARRLAFPLLLTAAALGTASRADAGPPEINTRCPVTKEEVDPNVTTDYRGKTVAFCCDRCRAKFNANPERYVGALRQYADAEASAGREDDDVDGADHGQAAHDSAGTTSLDKDSKAQGHGHDPGDAEAGDDDQPVPLLGRLHPVIVHFPLAGIPLAFLGFLAWGVTGREAFAKADVLPLVVGTLAAVAAVITGNIAHDSMQFSPSMHDIVERHQIVSTTIMVAALFLTALRVWRWKTLNGYWRWVYGGGLFVTSALLGLTGYLGGSLVFGPDHLAW